MTTILKKVDYYTVRPMAANVYFQLKSSMVECASICIEYASIFAVVLQSNKLVLMLYLCHCWVSEIVHELLLLLAV
jgi:hypothetical protein